MTNNGNGTNGHAADRTAERWADLIVAWRESGLSALQFCLDRGIPPRSFQNWLYAPRFKDRAAKVLAARGLDPFLMMNGRNTVIKKTPPARPRHLPVSSAPALALAVARWAAHRPEVTGFSVQAGWMPPGARPVLGVVIQFACGGQHCSFRMRFDMARSVDDLGVSAVLSDEMRALKNAWEKRARAKGG
jgi:hypothetical protein